MIRLPASEARRDFAATLRKARRGERVVLHHHGADVVAIVSTEDLALLEAIEDRMDIEDARATLAADPERVPWDQVKAALGLP
jgi:prevent-host-death family protein